MNNKIIYCKNCGKKGHIYKNCFSPLISLGIICIKYDGIDIKKIINKTYDKSTKNNIDMDIIKNIENNLKFLLICRRHTICYIEFIRGNYNSEDVQYMTELFNRMTADEINKIKNKDFDLLWNDLWISKNMLYNREYNISKSKFEILLNDKQMFNLDYYLNLDIKWYEPEWEFPKGKRNIKETDYDCANREFREETNFDENEYEIINFNMFNEIFMGNNGINYRYIYYLAQSKKLDEPIISDINFQQKIEISDIKWFTYSDAIKKIRHYHKERKELLTKIYNLLFFPIYNYFLVTK